jgi:membrane fusion protein (multidrug efflux system)
MPTQMARQPAVLVLLPAFFLILSITGGCSGVKPTQATAKAASSKEAAVPVHVFSVAPREVRRTVEAVGSLFPYDEVVVSAEVDGRAEKVLVDVGDQVTKGQTLVEILPTEFKLAADQQEAMLEQVRAKLGSADGEPDVRDPAQTAAVKKAAADLANARQKYDRSKTLSEQGLIPRQNFDEDEANYKAAQATYELAVQDVRNLQAAVKQERATRDLVNKKLRDTNILAPFGGYVKERGVTVGQYLKVQTPVMTIVNVDPMRVRLKVPEKMAAWVPVGQLVTLSVEAYPDRTFSGKIWRINPSVDPQTRTFDAEALIENQRGILKPGFFVKASIPSTKVDQVLLVPQKALSYAYGIYKVYAVTKENRLKEREVRLGDRLGQDVELIDGVREGDRLALPVEGQELAVKDGASVKIVDNAGTGEVTRQRHSGG